jgi:hypothetical protein
MAKVRKFVAILFCLFSFIALSTISGLPEITIFSKVLYSLCRINDDVSQFFITQLPGPPKMRASTVDSGKRSISVKTFGAKGDGVKDDTAPIQQAVNLVYASGGGTILFPPGTYLVTSVNIRENITYQGYGAIIKRPEFLTEKIGQQKAKWVRTFTNEKSPYRGDVDSKPLIIKGLTFDGSSQTQGSYRKNELEQAALVFLMGDKSKPGRLTAVVEDCTFRNGVGDGVHAHVNTNLKMINCTAENVFRGGFVLTGGYSVARVNNLTTMGEIDRTGIDVEVDTAGYGNTKKVEVHLENLILRNGDYDVGLSPGSTLYGLNIKVLKPPTYFYNKRAHQVYEDCFFALGVPYEGNLNAIVHPGEIQFNRCIFRATRTKDHHYYGASPYIQWNIAGTSERDQRVTFNDCRFEADESFLATDEIWGIVTGADLATFNNLLVVQGGEIGPRMNYGIRSRFYGGRWQVSSLKNLAQVPYRTYGITTHGGNRAWEYWYDVRLEDMETGTSNAKFISTGGANFAHNKLSFKNIIVHQAQNLIQSDWGLDKVTIESQRTILADGPPTSDSHGFIGDVWQKSKGERWRCIKAGYVYGRQFIEVPSEWRKIN